MSIHGEELSYFNLGNECQAKGIAEVHIWGSGLVCRTAGADSGFSLWSVSDFEEPRPVKLADTGIQCQVPLGCGRFCSITRFVVCRTCDTAIEHGRNTTRLDSERQR